MVLSLCIASGGVLAQQAKDGKAVVSHGFENSDSIRFALLRPYDVGYWLHSSSQPVDTGYRYVDRLIDSLGCSAVENFEVSVPGDKKFYGHQRVICAMGHLDSTVDSNRSSAFGPDLRSLGISLQQRLYYPNPQIWTTGYIQYGFRYNDISFNSQAKYFNNTYDVNDISPYYQYPPSHTYVTQSFLTTRFNTGSDPTLHTAYYGNEGRVLMGYSDDRLANYMLFATIQDSTNGFPIPRTARDTAKAFSVDLEFWADTITSHIDTALSPYATKVDSIPLVRLQVLYKPGQHPGYAGQSVEPFVTLKDATHLNNPGWYKCLDTIITRAIYRKLDSTWRADDSTFDASGVGHRAQSWRFKQLHAIIKLDSNLAKVKNDTNYGVPSNGIIITPYQHPDSLVAFGTSDLTAASDLLEIRVLSMYRDSVRVRSLTFEDTLADRYLYRRRMSASDSTHSLNPDGTLGGNDSLVNLTMSSWKTLLGNNRPREIMFNDNGTPTQCIPMMGYLDYMGSKYNIYAHWRPQDGGDY